KHDNILAVGETRKGERGRGGKRNREAPWDAGVRGTAGSSEPPSQLSLLLRLSAAAMRQLEDQEEGQGSGAHMISTARVPADKPVRIAFSLDNASDDTPPEDAIPLVVPELDQQLQPLPPCHDSMESMQVFKQHCQIAEEYREVKKEIALLEERKKELIAKLDQAEKEKLDAAQLAREFEALTEENRTLKLAQSQCIEQLEKLRIQYQKRQGSS
ncbi:hypothetical protein E2I00_008804, partial [Balaenoptera physalus]